jgi:hypothetical protein
MRLVEAKMSLYHVSSDPDLVINPDHELSGGTLGNGFYVTADPRVWQADQLPGKRKYVYRVDSSPLRIASSDDLDERDVTAWALDKGYYRMAPVIHPRTGKPVLSAGDEQPMIRPEVTEAGKHLFAYQDPITGDRMSGLNNAYLLDHGFNAYEPQYSRDGHQIIIIDPSVVRLTKLKSSPR